MSRSAYESGMTDLGLVTWQRYHITISEYMVCIIFRYDLLFSIKECLGKTIMKHFLVIS